VIVTVREEIEAELERQGERWSDIIAISIGGINDILDRKLGKSDLNRKDQVPYFEIWTERRVYFAAYDEGYFLGVQSVHRNPPNGLASK